MRLASYAALASSAIVRTSKVWCWLRRIMTLWAARLPHFIEAIFLPINGEVKTWEGGSRDFARDVRDRFVRTYGLSAQSVPVVTYDLEAAENGLAPFEQIRV